MIIRYKMYKTTPSNKKRLDIILVEKGLIETRSKANEVIKAGRVKVNNDIIQKSGTLVDSNSVIEIESSAFPYVSRSGEKLESALKKFQIDVRNKICLDIGASTGGFTDCLLKNGAKLVYTVDVGKNQLHPSLKNNNLVNEVKIKTESIKSPYISRTIDFIFSTPIFSNSELSRYIKANRTTSTRLTKKFKDLKILDSFVPPKRKRELYVFKSLIKLLSY